MVERAIKLVVAAGGYSKVPPLERQVDAQSMKNQEHTEL